jgi:hypothetical protein
MSKTRVLSFLLPGYSFIWHTPAVQLHGLF